MTMTPDEARVKVDAAREAFNAQAATAEASLEKLVREGLNALIAKLLDEQAKVVNSKEPADVATLKFNALQAIDAAVAGVHGIIASINLDTATRSARKNLSGGSYISLDSGLTQLLKPLVLLLRDAGFQVYSRNGTMADFRVSDLPNSTAFLMAARSLDGPAEQYGKAKIDLQEAEHAVAADKAKSAWDNA
jgi:hypothetical protein